MEFDFATLDTAHRYKVLASTVVPRPIAWVTSRAADGTANAAPYSFFNVMGSNPPVVRVGEASDGSPAVKHGESSRWPPPPGR